MKKLVNHLPFILLISLIGLSFYAGTNIGLSISILGLSGLSGYRFYLDEKKKPDLEKIFAERLKGIEDKYKEDLNWVKAELANVREKYGKVSMEKQQIKKIQQVNW